MNDPSTSSIFAAALLYPSVSLRRPMYAANSGYRSLVMPDRRSMAMRGKLMRISAAVSSLPQRN